jgi:hypothetical protein
VSFDALKKALVSTPLLKPPDLIYIATSEDTIGMVLVQEDDELYELNYTRVEKLALLDPELNYTHVER